MKITKRHLKRIIREETLNEGIWDTIKGAVGMGQDPADAGLEVQQIFEKMGSGVNGMLRLAAKGSQMAKYWESYTGGTRPEALMRGSIPSEYYRSSNQGGYGNILNSIGKFQDHFYDSLWNALAGAAPDAHGELDSIFRELASKPSRRSANKLRDVGVKIKDEALSSGDEDSLVEFNKLLKQWAGEQINQISFDANAWFEQHQGSFGLGESVVKVTKRQLKRIIRESKRDWDLEDNVSYFIAAGPPEKAIKYLEKLVAHAESGGEVGWKDAMNSHDPEIANFEYAKKRLEALKSGADGAIGHSRLPENAMSKRQLRKIIREAWPVGGAPSNAWVAFERAVEVAALPMLDAGMELDGVQQAMHDSIDNIFADWDDELEWDQALYDDEEEEAAYRLAVERG